MWEEMSLSKQERWPLISQTAQVEALFSEIKALLAADAGETQLILRTHFAKKQADALFTELFKQAQD